MNEAQKSHCHQLKFPSEVDPHLSSNLPSTSGERLFQICFSHCPHDKGKLSVDFLILLFNLIEWPTRATGRARGSESLGLICRKTLGNWQTGVVDVKISSKLSNFIDSIQSEVKKSEFAFKSVGTRREIRNSFGPIPFGNIFFLKSYQKCRKSTR